MMVRAIPCSPYYVGSFQAWLEGCAAKGQFLAAYGCGFCRFNKQEPMEVRYRLEPAAPGEEYPDWDRQQDCRAMGWLYVCKISTEFYVWQCEDPAAPEFYTEPEVQAEAYRRVSRKRWFSDILLMCLWALNLTTPFWRLRRRGWLAWTAINSGEPLWMTLVFLGMWALLFLGVLARDLALRRFLRPLKLGIPRPNREPYRRRQWLTGTYWVLMTVLLLAAIFGAAQSGGSYEYQEASSFGEEIPYVSLAQLGLSSQGTQVRREGDTWLLRDKWLVREQADGPAGIDCHTAAYRLRLAGLTGPLGESLARYVAGYEDAALEPVSAPGLDGGYYCGEDHAGDQFLLVWRKGWVITVSYNGTERLADHLDGYAAALAMAG